VDIASKLDLFLDVARQGSYTKAANLREMDRSSLSKQILALEKELGIRLLNRSTRSVQLTEAGKEVVKQVESVRQTISDTYRIVESFHSQPKGLLRITSPTLFGKLYVHKAIKWRGSRLGTPSLARGYSRKNVVPIDNICYRTNLRAALVPSGADSIVTVAALFPI